jgi:hypothetical protein
MARIFTNRCFPGIAAVARQFRKTLSFHRLTHNGRVLEYALILADRFDQTISYPVLLALPPGNQSK